MKGSHWYDVPILLIFAIIFMDSDTDILSIAGYFLLIIAIMRLIMLISNLQQKP